MHEIDFVEIKLNAMICLFVFSSLFSCVNKSFSLAYCVDLSRESISMETIIENLKIFHVKMCFLLF